MHGIAKAYSAVVAAVAVLVPGGIAAARPTFTPESIHDFSAALQTLRTAPFNRASTTLDARHSDATRYRAFRFLLPDTVMVGIAKAITIAPDGHVQIVQEPGAPMSGRPNPSHQEYSHVLLPVTVTPP